ncbi:MAG TPA: ATP-binding protein [Amycolatopsis sp.]|uniref:sensor histidine kinase n=1 Tax=Amycolatopsis sp. TaxID=37632 RepID=UPI002B4596A8|nr:ATP-binding protein [Amycolatopsis sp.]HKS44574.1 ATP-binding protein [Amycolatopsis sp.]
MMPAIAALFGAGLPVVAALATYQAQRTRQALDHIDATNTELAKLVGETLPTAVRKLREGTPANTTLAEIPQPGSDAHRTILQLLTLEVAASERRRAAAMAASANAAGRVQAMTTSMLADLREMEDCSEEMLGDLLKLDHSTAQVGRLADSIAVLAGARSGRRWTKPIVMESVLRGAMGRIGAYQRVRLHSTSTAAIVGYAAEDVMHALAELMDNATRFSAPSEEVHAHVEELHNGIVVTIEDAGLGMKSRTLERAEAAVSASEPLDLAKLSGTRLGLAVVGSLARKHRLEIFFRPSSRGGTSVVVRIPSQLITRPRAEKTPVNAHPTVPPPATKQPAASGLDGLPKRRRGQALAAAPVPEVPAPRPTTTRPRADSGARFDAFRQAKRRKPTTETETGNER